MSNNIESGRQLQTKKQKLMAISSGTARRAISIRGLRTFLEPHFIIPESLVAFCSVVFASKANKQTNKQTELFYTSGQTRPSGRSLRVLCVCQLTGHRLVMPLLLRPQLVMHWLGMHALAKDSPGWLGDVSVTDLPCVHAIYMEDHRRQTWIVVRS